ncbi:hypothetical protein [Pseudomonas sp. Teo4]|uniref:hypothetical protein n=1 Tax=Pseudomonas sp. Teo4 TaxID=3064528 RepID=UPI002ACB15D8|nr:hypothetical protein [Pseudomonas sp. Teo4]
MHVLAKGCTEGIDSGSEVVGQYKLWMVFVAGLCIGWKPKGAAVEEVKANQLQQTEAAKVHCTGGDRCTGKQGREVFVQAVFQALEWRKKTPVACPASEIPAAVSWSVS